jgi:hypothetical protein
MTDKCYDRRSRDARRARCALRGQLGYVGNLAEMALKRTSDRGSDILRACCRQRCLDRNGGEIDLGQRRDWQLEGLKNETAPAAASPNVNSVVATGRRIKTVDGCMARVNRLFGRHLPCGRRSMLNCRAL